MPRPDQIQGKKINWISTRIGQVEMRHSKLVGVKIIAMVIWSGGDGETALQLFIPGEQTGSTLQNAICCLAGDIGELRQTVIALMKRIDELEADRAPVGETENGSA